MAKPGPADVHQCVSILHAPAARLGSKHRPGRGPAGDRGSLEWWPGADVVDLISIAVYGLPDKNITDPEQQESFKTIFDRKYYRMRFVSKPVFITEFGVKGPEEFQNRWLAGAAGTIALNPQIIGVNYFNMVDTPKVWGENIKPPDWSISRSSFRSFADLLAPKLAPTPAQSNAAVAR